MRKSQLFTFIILTFAASSQLCFAQKQVDLESLNTSYRGTFFRLNLGISSGNFSYTEGPTTILDGQSIVPLHFDLNLGSRINRGIAPYFHMYGNPTIKESGTILRYSMSGMGIGSDFYLRGGNYYLGPEIGVAMPFFEVNNLGDHTDDLGVALTIKSGIDMSLGGKFLVGSQVFFTYYSSKDIDEPENGGKGYLFGVNLSLKIARLNKR